MKKNTIQNILTLLVVFALSSSALAQLPTTGDWRNRLGKRNPQEAERLYSEFFSPSSPINSGAPFTARSYEVLTRLRALAPYFSYSLYNGYLFEETQSNPNPMFQQLLDGEKDMSIKMMYVQDILDIHNRLVNNRDSINALRQTDANTRGREMSEALARIKYAHAYYKFMGNPAYYPAKLYNAEEAYKNYRSAFKLMLEQNNDISDEIEGNYLYEYFNTCYDLYKSDNEKYYTQFLEDYLEIVETCDNLLIPYYDVPDSIRLQDRKYTGFRGYRDGFADIPGSGIINMFRASGAATPEHLDAFYSAHLDENRKDADYLNKAIHLMMQNNATSTEAFYNYCEASYQIKPTFENCIGCALLASSMKQRQEMVNYYLEAKKWAQTDLQRGLVSYWIGTATSYGRPAKGTPEYEVWEKDVRISNTNLEDVLRYESELRKSTSLDIREYPAIASFYLGMNNYRLGGALVSIPSCNQAITYLEKSKKLGLTKLDADDMIANVRNTIRTINSNNAAAKKNDPRAAQRQKAYDEWRRKQQEEDAFWKAGR